MLFRLAGFSLRAQVVCGTAIALLIYPAFGAPPTGAPPPRAVPQPARKPAPVQIAPAPALR
ncbi:MAG TPA: hypothetical protein VGO90_14515, partial [Chthoniobacteraceae bacterium]|nr:hypothetical protein [Chthoniobacteraceae bacterium]